MDDQPVRYGPLSSSLRAPSPLPSTRRAFSLPAMRSYFPSFASTSTLLPLSSTVRSASPPPSRTVKRISYTLRSRAIHHKSRLILGSLVLAAIFLWANVATSSHPARQRLRGRSVQTTFNPSGPGKKDNHGVFVLDTDDAEEWLAEDDLFYAQYTEDEPLSPEDAAAEAEVASRKADVIEKNRQQSLRALSWWLAEGGEFPEGWEVPSKAYLRHVGGRGMERLLEDTEDEELDEEPLFGEGWADTANQSYRIVVFSKTYCPYSRRAKDVLSQYQLIPAPYIVELDTRPDAPQLQDLLMHLTGRRTVPNILLDSVSIGGSDDLGLMHSEGSLQRKFEEMGVLPGFNRMRMNQPFQPNLPIAAAAIPPPIPAGPAGLINPGAAADGVAGRGAVLDGLITPEKVGYDLNAGLPHIITGTAETEDDMFGVDDDEEEEEEDDDEDDEEEIGEEGDSQAEQVVPAIVPNNRPDHIVGRGDTDKAGHIDKLKAGADAAAIRAAVQAAHGDSYLRDTSDDTLPAVKALPPVHNPPAVIQPAALKPPTDELFLDQSHANARPDIAVPQQAQVHADLYAGAIANRKAQVAKDKVRQNQVKVVKGQQPWDDVVHVKQPQDLERVRAEERMQQNIRIQREEEEKRAQEEMVMVAGIPEPPAKGGQAREGQAKKIANGRMENLNGINANLEPVPKKNAKTDQQSDNGDVVQKIDTLLDRTNTNDQQKKAKVAGGKRRKSKPKAKAGVIVGGQVAAGTKAKAKAGDTELKKDVVNGRKVDPVIAAQQGVVGGLPVAVPIPVQKNIPEPIKAVVNQAPVKAAEQKVQAIPDKKKAGPIAGVKADKEEVRAVQDKPEGGAVKKAKVAGKARTKPKAKANPAGKRKGRVL